MSTRFYSLYDACDSETTAEAPYIIADERVTKSGELGRCFIVFDSFNKFLESREAHPHCHEILVLHKKIKSKYTKHGRLVFDFDIKKKLYNDKFVPSTFKSDVENVIISVIEMYYYDIQLSSLEFVWSTSKYENKFSKHLTIKNLCFEDWIEMSKVFYKLFVSVWDAEQFWIRGSELVDMQIVRKSASLRMVGSSKIGGSVLTFDNEKYTLIDSLIRPPYNLLIDEGEQFVTNDNYSKSIYDILQTETVKQLYNEEGDDNVYDICGYQISLNSSSDEEDSDEYTNKNIFVAMNVCAKSHKLQAK